MNCWKQIKSLGHNREKGGEREKETDRKKARKIIPLSHGLNLNPFAGNKTKHGCVFFKQ